MLTLQLIDIMVLTLALMKHRLAASMMLLSMIGAMATNEYMVNDYHVVSMLLAFLILIIANTNISKMLAYLFAIRILCTLVIYSSSYFIVVDTMLILVQFIVILTTGNDDGSRHNSSNHNRLSILFNYISTRGHSMPLPSFKESH